jgi:lipopolysaccharide export LptBFGC system permease protein LptF
MGMLDLVVASSPAPERNEGAPKGSEPPARTPRQDVAVFVTLQSLTTFPIASATVTVLWSLLARVTGTPGSMTSLLVISGAVGALIFGGSMTSKSSRPKTVGRWTLAVGIAVINSLFLAAAALGILGQAG